MKKKIENDNLILVKSVSVSKTVSVCKTYNKQGSSATEKGLSL